MSDIGKSTERPLVQMWVPTSTQPEGRRWGRAAGQPRGQAQLLRELRQDGREEVLGGAAQHAEEQQEPQHAGYLVRPHTLTATLAHTGSNFVPAESANKEDRCLPPRWPCRGGEQVRGCTHLECNSGENASRSYVAVEKRYVWHDPTCTPTMLTRSTATDCVQN